MGNDDHSVRPYRSTSSSLSNNYSSAAIGTSCQSPLPIYPPRESPLDTYEKDLETGSTSSHEAHSRKNEADAEEKGEGQGEGEDTVGRPSLSKTKKDCLLALFCLGVFMDVLGVCVFYILLTPVSDDLGIIFAQQTWIVTAFGLTFASFLLFWGRVSDLYSPKPVFCGGFLVFGLLNLIVSFMTDKYAFLILRGLAGISAAALIPASFRLITALFEEHELQRAFTVYSLSGSVAGACGVTFGGVMMLIPNGGQMMGWRWFFRICAGIVIPTSIWSVWYIPQPHGDFGKEKGKWKRLDVPGTFLILSAILFFILSLTLGASNGWATAGFIAPLIVSLLLFPAFFFWESKIPTRDALVPPITWKARNLTMWIVLSMFAYAWWTCNQIPIIESWVNVYHDKPIFAALRLLPSGGASILCSFILIAFPGLIKDPRMGMTVGFLGGMLGYALFILSDGKTGVHYFKFYLPGLAIGSFCNNISVTCIMVGAMTAAPPEISGVVGGMVQAAIQAGNVIALTVQAGLLTIHPGGVSDFRNVTASFAFMIGWGGACLVGFWVFYRTSKGQTSGAVAVH